MEYQKNHKSFKKLATNNSETVANENDQEIHNERYISPKERQKNIDNL